MRTRLLLLVPCLLIYFGSSANANQNGPAILIDIAGIIEQVKETTFEIWDRLSAQEKEDREIAIYKIAPQVMKIAALKRRIARSIEHEGFGRIRDLFQLANDLEIEVDILSIIIDDIDPFWGSSHIEKLKEARAIQSARIDKIEQLYVTLNAYQVDHQLNANFEGGEDPAHQWVVALNSEAEQLERFAADFAGSAIP